MESRLSAFLIIFGVGKGGASFKVDILFVWVGSVALVTGGVSLDSFLGVILLCSLRRDFSGKGKKSIRSVRTFFFLALVLVNRAPLIRLPPASADF